ncbi:MAG: MoaD/ThiS family protein [Candidatus Marsarchaeota archaeon]|nr:MoaD/ThiS family protein [Candidatus Marsarchaeota archaeon]
MNVSIKSRNKLKKVELKKGSAVQDAVKGGETGVFKVNGKIAHPRKTLKEGDVVEFVRVVYGG